MLHLRRFVVPMFLMGWMVAGMGVVSGQTYPIKPVRIVTSEPGGSTDFAARVIAQSLAGPLDRPVVIDNRPSSLVGEIVAKSPADGYTLLLVGSSFSIGPLLQKASYDPLKDFSPVSLTSSSPNLLVVHPSLPVKSVRDVIALAKARPGELNYGSGPTGSTPHLDVELFKSKAGVNIVRVPYKGGGIALNALISGEVQLMISPAGSVSTHLRSGRLKSLAVTTARPSALVPGLPTIAGTGLPGYESEIMNGMVAPARTPAAIINRLNQEIVRVLNSAETKERFFNAGADAVGSSPEEYGAKMQAEIAKYGRLIRDLGLKVD